MLEKQSNNYLIIGASRGLGKAFVDGLPVSGDHVFAVARTAVESSVTANVEVNNIQADLRSLDAHHIIKDAVAETPIDVLIYNAGIWEDASFEDMPDQRQVDIINVNLTNAMLISKAMLPNIRTGRAKKIIFISSVSGLDHYPSDSVAYAASKSGLRGLSHSLRYSLRAEGIAVTCLYPGSIATDIELAAGEQAVIDHFKEKRMPMADIVLSAQYDEYI